MNNSSATGGFLSPQTLPPPLGDLNLDVAIQQTLAGVLGFDLDHVRPRYQQVMPPQFEITENWMAAGVTTTTTPTRAAVIHHPDGDGYDELQQHENLAVTCSLFGPNAEYNYGVLRDGFQISQNREAMYALGLAFVSLTEGRLLPAVVGALWQRRVDCTVAMRRQVTRQYAVENLLGAEGMIERSNDTGGVDDTGFAVNAE